MDEKFFNRKYKFVRYDDQFDAYLEAIGLNFIKRKLAKQVPCSSELTKTGDNEYCFITHMPFNTLQQKFVPDVAFDQETADGRKVKNIFSFDGDNKMTEKQIESNREVIITRTFTEKEMLGYATVKDVKCQMWSEFVGEK